MTTDWHLIDSAPRDGSQFLAARPINDLPGYSMGVAEWVGEHAEAPWLTGISEFPDSDFRAIYSHWTRLPPPPEAH